MKDNLRTLYTWNGFDKDVIKLTAKLQTFVDSKLIKNIYGIPRGGLVVAVALSHLLNIPLVLEKRLISRKTLIVDDISDSGKTFEKIIKNKKYFGTLALYSTPWTRHIPTYYVRSKKQNNWIVFPWETIKTSKYDNK